LVENRDCFIPPCIRRPRYGGSRRNIAIPFGVGKLEWKIFEDMYNRLGTIPACDRRTERHLATAQSAR